MHRNRIPLHSPPLLALSAPNVQVLSSGRIAAKRSISASCGEEGGQEVKADGRRRRGEVRRGVAATCGTRACGLR